MAGYLSSMSTLKRGTSITGTNGCVLSFQGCLKPTQTNWRWTRCVALHSQSTEPQIQCTMIPQQPPPKSHIYTNIMSRLHPTATAHSWLKSIGSSDDLLMRDHVICMDDSDIEIGIAEPALWGLLLRVSEVWTMEEENIVPGATQGKSVARITIGKITKEHVESVKSILRKVPVTNGDPSWRSRNWIIEAVQALHDSGLIATLVDLADWDTLEKQAKTYAQQKTAACRFRDAGWNILVVPTYDMMASKEVVA